MTTANNWNDQHDEQAGTNMANQDSQMQQSADRRAGNLQNPDPEPEKPGVWQDDTNPNENSPNIVDDDKSSNYGDSSVGESDDNDDLGEDTDTDNQGRLGDEGIDDGLEDDDEDEDDADEKNNEEGNQTPPDYKPNQNDSGFK